MAQRSSGPLTAEPQLQRVLRSSGRPLDSSARAMMEPRFGQDFSRVRVHTGAEADRSAADVGAEAYTVGQHIVFRDGRYSASNEGKSLLAHELAHTVQQRSRGTEEPVALTSASDRVEQQAHTMATSAAAFRPLPPVSPTGPMLACATRTFQLTFDDGPHAAPLCKGINRTEAVLNTLCDKKAQAAFFVQTAAEDATGAKIRGSSPVGKKLITRMNADGHTVGIHTGGKKDHEDHPDALKAGRLTSELSAAKTAISGLTGKTPTLVRPPHGRFNPAVSKVYSSLGLTNVLWDIDGDQGKNLPLTTLKARVTAGIKAMIAGGWAAKTPMAPKIVVLYHDIQHGTSSNIGALIDFIKSEVPSQTGGADTADFPPVTCKKPSCTSDSKPAPAPAKKAPAKEKPKEKAKPKEPPKETPKEKPKGSKTPPDLVSATEPDESVEEEAT